MDKSNLIPDTLSESDWREGFEAMGADSNGTDVEFMLPAALEVILKQDIDEGVCTDISVKLFHVE